MTTTDHSIPMQTRQSEHGKILLALLPFWTPLIPPLGISCLKGFLQHYGYSVRTVDVNVEGDFTKIHNSYFDLLKTYIPADKQGNFYNIGNEVLQNHLMAHLHHTDEKKYRELVTTLVSKTFFCHLDVRQLTQLNDIVTDFYDQLETYFIDLLAKEKPAVLGLSVSVGTLPASLFVFRLAKQQIPGIMTVMGGSIFADNLAVGSPDLEFFLEKTTLYIDKLIIGEGELLFLKLLQGELPESQKVYRLNDIHGEMLDLSCVNIPDFSDFDLQYYPYLASYTSRSCPFQCTFCSETVQWGPYRKKPAKQIVEELTALSTQHKSQLFLMGDSLLNPVIAELTKECIQTDAAVYWDGYLRVAKAVCDPENTLIWRKGGFYRARLGVESGSPHVLEMMRKKITPQQIKDSIYSLAYAGIKTTTYWVVGYPGETEDDFRMTLALIEELKDDIYEAECNPFHYFFDGQTNSEEWAKKQKHRLLYPENARDMLIVQTWILDSEPSREETYRRVSRFVKHCNTLGLPNPYSLYDVYEADKRWEKLHKNAVPSIAEFQNVGSYIDESKHVKMLLNAENTRQDDGDFDF